MANPALRTVTPTIKTPVSPTLTATPVATHQNIYQNVTIYGAPGQYYFIWNNRQIGFFADLPTTHLRIDWEIQRQAEHGFDI